MKQQTPACTAHNWRNSRARTIQTTRTNLRTYVALGGNLDQATAFFERSLNAQAAMLGSALWFGRIAHSWHRAAPARDPHMRVARQPSRHARNVCARRRASPASAMFANPITRPRGVRCVRPLA